MTDEEFEEILRSAAPRHLPVGLRNTVMSKVAAELQGRRRVRRQRLPAFAAAALLLLAVGMNAWIGWNTERTMAHVYHPRPIPRAIADIESAVVAVAGSDAGISIRQQLLAVRSPARPSHIHPPKLQELILQLQLANKGNPGGIYQERPQMERHHRHGGGRNTTDRQWRLQSECILTA